MNIPSQGDMRRQTAVYGTPNIASRMDYKQKKINNWKNEKH